MSTFGTRCLRLRVREENGIHSWRYLKREREERPRKYAFFLRGIGRVTALGRVGVDSSSGSS